MITLSADICEVIVEDFLRNSYKCVEALTREVASFQKNSPHKIWMYYFKNGKKNEVALEGNSFFLRGSVEYSNPQLTVEEIQGIIATRLLECCANYLYRVGECASSPKDVDGICEMLKKPCQGPIVSFLLNTDDIEPDRYSINPLKESIVNSGQSAFPASKVTTEQLEIDQRFIQKYEGSLISRSEIEQIVCHLESCNNSYTDMVDAIKYDYLERLSKSFGIYLPIYSMRIPLSGFEQEKPSGLLHQIVKETHKDYNSIECIYKCMGRSTKNLTTLLTVPHSKRGYASKRAARGRIYFDGTRLEKIKVTYQTTLLYENGIDASDVSFAKADDRFIVEGNKFIDYDFKETPSSPQFFLYALASPENAVVWHGIGEFGASELLKSYTTTRLACGKDLLVENFHVKYGLTKRLPLQFNLVPKYMWVHPKHRNIDASIGTVDDFGDLMNFGMKVEHLPTERYIRSLD